MTYKCYKCSKIFPISGWIISEEKEESGLGSAAILTGRTIRKKIPCCPYCHAIEIEEVKEHD